MKNIKLKDQTKVKRSWPLSRVLSRTVIHLGPASPRASGGLPRNSAGHTIVPLFGLTPGGACLATDVASRAVRSYRTISPLPVISDLAVYFLWRCPSAHAAQALPGTLPYGARTFLRPATRTWLGGDCLANSVSIITATPARSIA